MTLIQNKLFAFAASMMLAGFVGALVLVLFACAAIAQSNFGQTVQQRLNEAEACFQRNDYEMGANRIREAGYMLKSTPQALPGADPVGIASAKTSFLDDKLTAVWSRKDFEQAKRLITAEQTLLTCLSNWEPQNPKWHYQRALLYKATAEIPLTGIGAQMAAHLGIQNNLHNEMDMRPLQSAIQECDKVLNMADSTYVQQATQLKNTCLSEIQRRNGKIQAVNESYQRKLPRGMGTGESSIPFKMTCGLCGEEGHETLTCPNKRRFGY